MPTTSACPNCARPSPRYTSGAASAGRRRRASPITSGGVNALMLAVQALVDAGDEVVAVTPVWPNLTAQPAILGATRALRVAGARGRRSGRSTCTRCAPPSRRRTKLLIVNAPNNPTGWTLTRAEQQAILDHCRATGTWILADEVYERLYYEPTPNGCAPSFLDVADAGRPPGRRAQLLQELPDDRLAPRLAGAAAGADGRHGQADRVQHLVRQRVHAARRHRRAGARATRSRRASSRT